MLKQAKHLNRFITALFLGFVLSCGGGAHATDREKLRGAAPFPQLDINVNFAFGISKSAEAPQDEAATRAQIAQLSAVQNPTSEQLLQLGQLYSGKHDSPRAREAFAHAVPLLRAALATHPDDDALLVQLGRALKGSVQSEEAETALRHAVQVAPQNAHAWGLLSEVLLEQATQLVIPTTDAYQFHFGNTSSFEGIDTALLGSRPDEATLISAQDLFDEARECDARATQAAPGDASIYAQRITSLIGEASLGAIIQTLRANQTATRQTAIERGALAMASSFLSPEMFANWQTIARLRPDDAAANASAAIGSLVLFMMRSHTSFPLKNGLDAVPAPDSASIREDMGRLQTQSQKGGKDAAPALEALGVLGFALGDASAVDTLRRALTLDPSRTQAREALMLLLVGNDRYDELATFLETQLKRGDTVRNHLLLAKTYDKLQRPEDAQAQVSAALELAPDDFTANLARAALALRRGDTTQANEPLVKAARSFEAPTKPSDKQTREYAVLRGIYLGLAGSTDEAKQQLQQVLASDAQNEAAQKALAALNS